MNESGDGNPALADALSVAAAAWLSLRGGSSLDRALAAATERAALERPTPLHPRLAAAAKDIAYTATRHLALIEALLARLAERTPDAAVGALIAVALGQLLVERQAPYTIVDQAVSAAKAQSETRAASGFVNAVLRNALRRLPTLRPELEKQPVVAFNVPRWWLDRLRQAEPAHFAEILKLQRQAPPLVLRVNSRRASVDDYLRRLQAEGVAAQIVGPTAVRLQVPLPVQRIPGFLVGEVSVQDAGAQLAVSLLDVRAGMHVLDACAAPGGKTAQLSECADGLSIDAIDVDAQRATRIEENLARLNAREHAQIRIVVADVTDPAALGVSAAERVEAKRVGQEPNLPRIRGRALQGAQREAEAKWDSRPPVAADSFLPRGLLGAQRYDRILLDAPCTASGIVRRHPDIPWLRRAADVAQLATLQARLLDAVWPLLAPTGRLLYVVCSLFDEEGPRQAERFLARQEDARAVALPGIGQPQLRLLPADRGETWTGGLPSVRDGFFFALFEKI